MNNVFDPGQISQLSVGAIQRAKENPEQLYTGIPQLDLASFEGRSDHYVMLRPGKVTTVLADTSNGKTSWMSVVARHAEPQLRPEEIVAWATWEDAVEDFGLNQIAYASKIPAPALYRGELNPEQTDAMMRAAIQRAASPLWIIGHSETAQSRRPRLTMTDIWEALEFIVDKQGKKIRILFLDYLQRINFEDTGERQRREGFTAVMDKIKDVALAFNCAVVVGSQVKREVADRGNNQPMVHDGLEASNIEQTSDGIISLWIPKKNKALGEGTGILGKDNREITVTPNLMLMQVLKQKRAEAPFLRAVDFIAPTNEIREYTR